MHWIAATTTLVFIVLAGVLAARGEKRWAILAGLFVVLAIVSAAFSLSSPKHRASAAASAEVCVVQYDNRSRKQLGDLAGLQDETRSRCENDKSCRMLDMSTDKTLLDVPPYWAKVFAVRKAALTNPRCSWLMWLDTDARLTGYWQLSKYVDSVSNSRTYFVYSDAGPWGGANFNAGVWFVKNSAAGQAFLSEWEQAYREAGRCWSQAPRGKWECRADIPGCNTPCVWAGSAYEQGALAAKLRRPVHKLGCTKVDSCDIMHDATNRSLKCQGRKPVASHFVFKEAIAQRHAQGVLTRASWELGTVFEQV